MKFFAEDFDPVLPRKSVRDYLALLGPTDNLKLVQIHHDRNDGWQIFCMLFEHLYQLEKKYEVRIGINRDVYVIETMHT